MKEWYVLIEFEYTAKIKGLESRVESWIDARPGRACTMHEAIKTANKILNERDINITVYKHYYNSDTTPAIHNEEALKVWRDAKDPIYTIRHTHHSVDPDYSDTITVYHDKKATAADDITNAIISAFRDCMQYDINIANETINTDNPVFYFVPCYDILADAIKKCEVYNTNNYTAEQTEEFIKGFTNKLYDNLYIYSISWKHKNNPYAITSTISDLKEAIKDKTGVHTETIRNYIKVIEETQRAAEDITA